MSARPLDSDGSGGDEEEIYRMAESKGIELDAVEVVSEEDDQITYRAYETKAETEEDSVGIQVTKVTGTQMSDISFNNAVQRKLSSLKRAISGEDRDIPDDEEIESEQDTDTVQTDTDDDESVSRATVNVDPDASGPGAQIDAQLAQIEAEIEQLDERVSEIEQYVDVLEGMQKTFGGEED